jgi:hypothetical protein
MPMYPSMVPRGRLDPAHEPLIAPHGGCKLLLRPFPFPRLTSATSGSTEATGAA